MVNNMERWKLIGYAIPATTALLLIAALWIGNMALSFVVLAGAIAAVFLYSEWLRKKGEVLSDERTLRIEEMASRRTLQVLILVLAFLVIALSILSEKEESLRSAYYLSLALMVLVSLLKLSLKHYYARVM